MASLIVLEYLTRKALEVAENMPDVLSGEARASVVSLLRDVHTRVSAELRWLELRG